MTIEEMNVVDDEELIVDVVEPEIATHKPNPMVRRAEEAVLVNDEDKSFEKVMQAKPAVMDEDGNQVAFDPRRHVAFAISDEVRGSLNALIGQSEKMARDVVSEMIEKKEVGSMRMVRLTETIDAAPVPGRVTVVLNFDKSVNAIDVE